MSNTVKQTMNFEAEEAVKNAKRVHDLLTEARVLAFGIRGTASKFADYATEREDVADCYDEVYNNAHDVRDAIDEALETTRLLIANAEHSSDVRADALADVLAAAGLAGFR